MARTRSSNERPTDHAYVVCDDGSRWRWNQISLDPRHLSRTSPFSLSPLSLAVRSFPFVIESSFIAMKVALCFAVGLASAAAFAPSTKSAFG
jgi:hypothetical protein